jgi:hypothetical protein
MFSDNTDNDHKMEIETQSSGRSSPEYMDVEDYDLPQFVQDLDCPYFEKEISQYQ